MAWHVGFHLELACSYWNVNVKCSVNITYALMWGVALIGGILCWAWLTLYGTTFQVQGVHRWTVLSQGYDCGEGQHVALINPFRKKCLEQTSSSMCLCKRLNSFWTIDNIVGYVIMVI